jgi:hypothetical protein
MNYKSEAFNRYIPISSSMERKAKLPGVYENIRVISNTEEIIFEDTFVTGVLPNSHQVKVKKSSLVYDND